MSSSPKESPLEEKSSLRLSSYPDTTPPIKWGLGIQVPLMIFIPFLLSVGLAVGHHEFYHYLDQRDIGDPITFGRALKVGNIISSLFGGFFQISVATVLVQAVRIYFLPPFEISNSSSHPRFGVSRGANP
jgi:hypothetical protein